MLEYTILFCPKIVLQQSNLDNWTEIKIEFERMACSMVVIDETDCLNEVIKPHDRKTKGDELESYGIARSCQFANMRKTKFIIFKWVMDNTSSKNDAAKPNAAWTIAQFLKQLLLDNYL